MKKIYIKLYIIELIMFFALMFNKFLLNSDGKIMIFFCGILAFLIFNVGYEKDKQYTKTEIIQLIIIYTIGYLVLTYIFGFFIGFSKNSYKLDILSIIKNIVPAFIIIVLKELIRYIILSKGKKEKKIIIFSFIIFTLFDILYTNPNYDFSNFQSGLKLISLIILPAISKNTLYTYLSIKVGYKPILIYQSILELTKYFLPIFPNFGYYVQSVLDITFPVIIFLKMSNILSKKSKISLRTNQIDKLGITLIIILLIVMVYLISNLFKYTIIAVGSNSMYPNIKVGDIVLIEKVPNKDIKKLKVGQVLVYKHNNKIIVHRISSIKYKYGEYFIITKGDNNKENDKYEIEDKDVIGIVKLKISYLGYPSVWLNNTLNSR